MRILIVDDEENILAQMKELLEDYCNCIETESNGLNAFENFANSELKFDLIISDFNMPILNGVDFKNKIHSSCKECPPFIFYTGNATGLSKENISGEIFAIVEKPNFDSLRKHVSDLKKSAKK